MSETKKARDRRRAEGWYEKYIFAPGLDIGSGIDPLDATGFDPYDYCWGKDEKGNYHERPSGTDAQRLPEIASEIYATVYASHILEHLEDPHEALRNWWRVLQPGGYLIVCVPHRDLYEKKKTKPSRWNPHTRPDGGGHLTFWLPDQDDPPDTLSLRRVVSEAIPDGEVVEFRVLDAGYDYNMPELMHPVGEYAIEVILRKPK